MLIWTMVLGAWAQDGHEVEADRHRALGIKLVDLIAISEEQTSSWLGIGFIAELPLTSTLLVEVAANGLAGTPAAPGFAVPVDLLLKRAWVQERTVVTVGGGPSLTYMRTDEREGVYPGALATLGGSYWYGPDHGWGLLAEVDAGAAFESSEAVTELEFSIGVLFRL